jgi:LAO/AO transport system kinase
VATKDYVLSLVERAERGDRRALGRLLTILEDVSSETAWVLEYLTGRSRGAHVIGVTGIPGSGKSSLISRMIRVLRDKGYRVAVITIDPTSPLSSGAILGDRLRMQEHATDPGVFIRSVTTAGALGGLSLSALAMIEAFDALGYDKVIVETVGVGQSETHVMHAADTIVVVTMPGAGDDVQALKAGVLEIGDIYVVNKSDKPEASKTYEYMLFVAEKGEIGRSGAWKPVVVKTSSTLGMGIRELVEAVEKHLEYLRNSGEKLSRLSSRRRLLVKLLAEKIVLDLLDKVAEEELAKTQEGLEGFYKRAIEIARTTGEKLLNLKIQ